MLFKSVIVFLVLNYTSALSKSDEFDKRMAVIDGKMKGIFASMNEIDQ